MHTLRKNLEEGKTSTTQQVGFMRIFQNLKTPIKPLFRLNIQENLSQCLSNFSKTLIKKINDYREYRRLSKIFVSPTVPKYPCVCHCSEFGIFKRKTFNNFNEWSVNYLKRVKEKEKKDFQESIKLVEKCNSVHKGSQYIKNTPGYVIEAENVSKWFSNRVSQKYIKVLSNINLRIKYGEFVVVVGYSGSGKSTLLNVLSGVERPSNGTVIVAGHNLISLSDRSLTNFRKDNLSFIFQNYALLPDLTVRENINQGAELQENVYKRLDIDELVEFLGIEEHLDKYPNQLSGGQQQRVAIVKSIIKNPHILFADEPTAAVDEDTAKTILKIFCDINEKYKTTIVLITHNPIIAKLATRLVHIEKGYIVKSIKQKPLPLEKLPWIIKNGK